MPTKQTPNAPLIEYEWFRSRSELFSLRMRLKERGVGSWTVGLIDSPILLKWRLERAKNKLMKRRNRFLKKINRSNEFDALIGDIVGSMGHEDDV